MSNRTWTPEQERLMRELYPTTRAQDIADRLGRPLSQVYSKASKMKLWKSPEFLASQAGRLTGKEGVDHRFKPGHKPWCTGRTGIRKMRSSSSFKPGQMPSNHLPVGTVVMATIGYLKIKIAEPRQWALLHRHNWEQVNGPIPPGHNLVFRDGDRTNCAIENLELVARRDMMLRNSITAMPPELAELSRMRGQITKAINKREKEQANEQDR